MKILFVIVAYLLGAIPTGYLAFRMSEKKDIREFGSKNTGATNVLRLKGLKLALPVLLIDVLKGFWPAFLAVPLFGDPLLGLIASFAAVIGHCYPVYIRFRGGKGVAATIGAFAAVALQPFLFSLAVFVGAVAFTRYVSLGSILAAASYPLFVVATGGNAATAIWGGALAVLVIYKHSENIRRLRAGRERKLGEKAA